MSTVRIHRRGGQIAVTAAEMQSREDGVGHGDEQGQRDPASTVLPHGRRGSETASRLKKPNTGPSAPAAAATALGPATTAMTT
jgi:hypothetical protein